MASGTLLASLREQVLDEAQPLAGLLRKCLVLGAETGSEALRQWARSELNGYAEGVPVPEYRAFVSPPISVDSISGRSHVRGQIFDRLQLPPKALVGVPETFEVRQPVEELETMAGTKSLYFASPGLAYAQSVWNSELDMFQQIVGMSYMFPGSVLAGVLGQVRTRLVDLVAELTANTPLAELPGKATIDAAVGQHIGTQYVTTIGTANGPAAIGNKAEAVAEGLGLDDVLQLLAALLAQAEEVTDDHRRAELITAVQSLEAEVRRGSEADTGEVVRKAGVLKRLGSPLAVAGTSAAITGAVEAVTTLAVNGAFG